MRISDWSSDVCSSDLVLHRAAAEREQPQVDCIILARQAGIVPPRFGFAEPRQADGGGAREDAKVGSGRIFVEIDAGGGGRTDLEDQRFFQHQRAVAGEGRRFVGPAGVHFGAPAGGVERGHASTSFSAAAKAAISASDRKSTRLNPSHY